MNWAPGGVGRPRLLAKRHKMESILASEASPKYDFNGMQSGRAELAPQPRFQASFSSDKATKIGAEGAVGANA